MIHRNFNAPGPFAPHSRTTALARWPFAPLRPALRGSSVANQEAGDWLPAVDVRETDTLYAIDLEIPGVAKDDVSVEFDDGVLTVKGEKKPAELAEGEKLNRAGRRYGSFTRSFRLPTDAEDEQLRAVYRNGVLSVEIPKREETKPRNVEIH